MKYEVRKKYEDGSYDVLYVCDTYEEASHRYEVADRFNQEFDYAYICIKEVGE